MEILDPKNNFEHFESEVTEEQLRDASQKKILAGILGLVFPGIGLHKFIVGYTREGILAIVFLILTCGLFSIVGFIESIIYLTKTDREFYETYIVGDKPWF